MDSEKQVKVTKFRGIGTIIAKKTGYSGGHVRDVLIGKRSRKGKKGRKIMELALQIIESLDKIRVDDNK